MSLWTAILAVFAFFWELLKSWVYLFYVSFTNLDTIWIIIPIWLSWFFAEFFQEKRGTSFGNAISNGVIPLWIGIDWTRQLTTQFLESNTSLTFLIFSKYIISALVIIYGLIIVAFGIKGREFIRYIGRIREVTYVLAVFTPIMYGLVALDYKYFLSIILFFPLFYLVIELIDRLTPEPKIYEKEMIKTETNKTLKKEKRIAHGT